MAQKIVRNANLLLISHGCIVTHMSVTRVISSVQATIVCHGLMFVMERGIALKELMRFGVTDHHALGSSNVTTQQFAYLVHTSVMIMLMLHTAVRKMTNSFVGLKYPFVLHIVYVWSMSLIVVSSFANDIIWFARVCMTFCIPFIISITTIRFINTLQKMSHDKTVKMLPY